MPRPGSGLYGGCAALGRLIASPTSNVLPFGLFNPNLRASGSTIRKRLVADFHVSDRDADRVFSPCRDLVVSTTLVEAANLIRHPLKFDIVGHGCPVYRTAGAPGLGVGKSVGKSHIEKARQVLKRKPRTTRKSRKPLISRTFGSSTRWAVLGSNQ